MVYGVNRNLLIEICSIATPKESMESSPALPNTERCHRGGYLQPLGHRVCLLGPPVDPSRAEEENRADDKVGRIYKEYGTLEEMKADKTVYRAVRAIIKAAHQRDGVTVEQILRETVAQRRDGRLRYSV